MKVSVWDTYVQRPDGKTMHFDIIVSSECTNANIVYEYGMSYLKSKGLNSTSLSTKECRFCHMEQASPEIIKGIKAQGFFILEMEHCD